LEALGINLGYLLVQVFNFLILVVVLKEWVYKPVLKLLEDRRTAIAQGLEDARIAAEARANAEQQAAKIVADAQVKGAEVVREASVRAEEAVKGIKAAAEADAAKARQTALEDAEGDRNRILSELRVQVAAISMAATQKLVGEALDEKRQHALLDEFFSGVKAGKVVVLEGASVRGGAAEVTSALPLSAEEQAAVKSDVLTKLGDAASVTFRVDPSILGGLKIKVGDKVLDDSVAGKLGTLRESLR